MIEKSSTFSGAAGVSIREMLRAVISHEVANKFSVLSIYLGRLRRSRGAYSGQKPFQDSLARLTASMLALEQKVISTRDALARSDASAKAELEKQRLSPEITKLHQHFSPLRSLSLERQDQENLEVAARTALNMRRAVELCERIISSDSGAWEQIAPGKIAQDIRSAVDPEFDDRLEFDLGKSAFLAIRVHLITALTNYVINATRSARPGQADHRISVQKQICRFDELPGVIRASPKQVAEFLDSAIPDWNVFSVRNNGSDIPPDHLSAIWGFGLVLDEAGNLRSTAEDDDLDDRMSGRGLGLPLAKYAAEQHGGGVWVRNNSDSGVTFYFITPINNPKANGI